MFHCWLRSREERGVFDNVFNSVRTPMGGGGGGENLLKELIQSIRLEF